MNDLRTTSKNFYALMLALFFLTGIAIGQKSQLSVTEKQKHIEQDIKVKSVEMSATRKTPRLIEFKHRTQEAYSLDEATQVMQGYLGSQPGITQMKVKKSTQDAKDISFIRYQQYYKGIKVEHGQYVAMGQEGKLAALQGEYYEIDQLSLQPSLTEEQALQAALTATGAQQYVWEYLQQYMNGINATEIAAQLSDAYYEYYPKGELVIVDNYQTSEIDLGLAYKFNIYASEPLSREWIYINAHNGKVMLRDAIIKHASTIVNTRYSGSKTIETSFVDGQNPNLLEYPFDNDGYFILKDETRGNGIQTFDMNGVGGAPVSVPFIYSVAVDFVDDDNNWDLSEHVRNPAPTVEEAINDDIAWDAHWGAEMVYDYWKDRHNRDSYDDNDAAINSYIHYGEGYDNAFWNGSAMTYGDGSYKNSGLVEVPGFSPLVAMDVCAHEIGHAVCSHTADLVYQRESGGMNEGFSDIWAACVENYIVERFSAESFDYNTWGIGEQIDQRDGFNNLDKALRWMDDPKVAGDPDTYGGDNWQEPECGEPTLANDYCGVHTNSGVLNKWFYLLTAGSGNAPDDGINDLGSTYSINGLGFAKSELIAFGTEVQLSPNATFADARAASIQYARTVFGPCSPEEEATTNAWFAVGVGPAFICSGGTVATGFAASGTMISETANGNGFCDDSKSFELELFINAAATFNLEVEGTATQGVDYQIASTTISHNSSSLVKKTITIEIIDDASQEGFETIILTIPSAIPSVLGSDQFVLTIRDDDVAPVIGIGETSLLYERFLTTTMPTDWKVIENLPSMNAWHFGGYQGTAYISFTGSLPNYEANNNPTDLILRTPLLDARGLSNVNVSFDWTAGGETDLVIGGGEPFDFGRLVYSLDGVQFFPVNNANFVGDNFGASVNSGTFTVNLSNLLDNQVFFLGFQWMNDALLGTAYSFAIDNVRVNAKTRQVETALNETIEEYLGPHQVVTYYSASDGEIMASFVNNSDHDFGCTSLVVERAGTGAQGWYAGASSMPKALRFTPENANADANLHVTMFYTESELAGFETTTGVDRNELSIYNTEASDLSMATSENSEIFATVYQPIYKAGGSVIAGMLLADVSGTPNGLVLATAPAQGLVIDMPDSQTGVEQREEATLSLYPNPARNQVRINCDLIGQEGVTLKILNLQGQALRIINLEANAGNSLQLDVSDLTPGLYLIQVQTQGTQFVERLVVE